MLLVLSVHSLNRNFLQFRIHFQIFMLKWQNGALRNHYCYSGVGSQHNEAVQVEGSH